MRNMSQGFLIAKENFRRAGMEERITLLEGDAEEILNRLEGAYDFIFMDAAKGQYIHWLPVILKLLAPGGLLVSDNVLAARRCRPSQICGRTARPDHTQPHERIFIYVKTYGSAGDFHCAHWR